MSTPEIEQLIKKAENGDIRAMLVLAQRYRDGDGVTRDYAQFLQWLMKLRKRLGFSKRVKALLSFEGKTGNELKGFVAWLQDGATSGNAMHMNFLAILYREGIGVGKDLKQFIEWLHKAIAAGDVDSMNNLAWAYREGEGVEKDLERYIEWLHKAIEAGNPWFMKNLALDYRNGVGVTADPQQSMQWFFRAAEGGDEYALYEVRRMYQSREFEKHCSGDDIGWLTRAAVIDDGNLYVELAVKHWTRDAEGDHDKCRHWLEQGEYQGNVRAFIFGSLLRLSDSQSFDRATISDLCEVLQHSRRNQAAAFDS